MAEWFCEVIRLLYGAPFLFVILLLSPIPPLDNTFFKTFVILLPLETVALFLYISNYHFLVKPTKIPSSNYCDFWLYMQWKFPLDYVIIIIKVNP